MDERDVSVAVRARVGWLQYAREPANVFTEAMVGAVHEALEGLLAEPRVRVVVFASALEKHFSSGADLKAFRDYPPERIHGWTRLCHAVVRLMRGSPKPLLAAVNGTAVGGGLEMALHCDVRFAATNLQLGLPEVRFGFIPPFGGTQALARLMGRPRALRFLYDAAFLDAERALALGLVDELTAPDALHDTVQAYGEALAARPADALAAVRRCITEGGAKDFDAGLDIEYEEAVRLAGSTDFAEGVRAFLEKREPRWQDG